MAGGNESVFVIVPRGWSRQIEEHSVHYISPDHTTLRSRDELLYYLMSSGTCKCGLICPFQLDVQFSFDSDIISLPDQSDVMSLCKYTHMTSRYGRTNGTRATVLSSLDDDNCSDDIKILSGTTCDGTKAHSCSLSRPNILTSALYRTEMGARISAETSDDSMDVGPNQLTVSPPITSFTKSHLQLFNILNDCIIKSPQFKLEALTASVTEKVSRYASENDAGINRNISCDPVNNKLSKCALMNDPPSYKCLKENEVENQSVVCNGTHISEVPLKFDPPRKHNFAEFKATDQKILYDGICHLDSDPPESLVPNSPVANEFKDPSFCRDEVSLSVCTSSLDGKPFPKCIASKTPVSGSLPLETAAGSEVSASKEPKLIPLGAVEEPCITDSHQKPELSSSVIASQSSDVVSRITRDIPLKGFHISLRDCSLSPQRGCEKPQSPQKHECSLRCTIDLQKYSLNDCALPKILAENVMASKKSAISANDCEVETSDAINKQPVQDRNCAPLEIQDMKSFTESTSGHLTMPSDDEPPVFIPPMAEQSLTSKEEFCSVEHTSVPDTDKCPEDLSVNGIHFGSTCVNGNENSVKHSENEPTQNGCGLEFNDADDSLKVSGILEETHTGELQNISCSMPVIHSGSTSHNEDIHSKSVSGAGDAISNHSRSDGVNLQDENSESEKDLILTPIDLSSVDMDLTPTNTESLNTNNEVDFDLTPTNEGAYNKALMPVRMQVTSKNASDTAEMPTNLFSAQESYDDRELPSLLTNGYENQPSRETCSIDDRMELESNRITSCINDRMEFESTGSCEMELESNGSCMELELNECYINDRMELESNASGINDGIEVGEPISSKSPTKEPSTCVIAYRMELESNASGINDGIEVGEPISSKSPTKEPSTCVIAYTCQPTFFSCEGVTCHESISDSNLVPSVEQLLSTHQFDTMLTMKYRKLGVYGLQTEESEMEESEKVLKSEEVDMEMSAHSDCVNGSVLPSSSAHDGRANQVIESEDSGVSGKKRPASWKNECKTPLGHSMTKKKKVTKCDILGDEFDCETMGSPSSCGPRIVSSVTNKAGSHLYPSKDYPIRSRRIYSATKSQMNGGASHSDISPPDCNEKLSHLDKKISSEKVCVVKRKRGRPGNAMKKLASDQGSSSSSHLSTTEHVPDPEISLAMEELFNDESELELIVSIPLRIGKKRLTNHTLLLCTGSEKPAERKANFSIGDVIWAKAAMLPAWPGKIISFRERDLKRPPCEKEWVEWFGESTVSLVNKGSIKTLREGVGKRLKVKPLTEDLKNAINLAIAEAVKQKLTKEKLTKRS